MNTENIEIKNAVIESAEITMAERGILDCWLHLDVEGTGQGFGGYALYLSKSFSHHQVLSVAGHHMFRIMEIAGVEKWSQLEGKTIRVEGSCSKIERIGHIVKDDWYCPSVDFKAAELVKDNTVIESAEVTNALVSREFSVDDEMPNDCEKIVMIRDDGWWSQGVWSKPYGWINHDGTVQSGVIVRWVRFAANN